MGTSAPHIQSQVHRHRSNWRGLVVVLILAVVIALVLIALLFRSSWRRSYDRLASEFKA